MRGLTPRRADLEPASPRRSCATRWSASTRGCRGLLLPEGGVGDPRHAAAHRARGALLHARHRRALRGDLRDLARASRSATASRSSATRHLARRAAERHGRAVEARPRPLLRDRARSRRSSARSPTSTPGSPACAATSRRRAPTRPSWTGTTSTACGRSTRWPTGPRATSGATSPSNDVPYNPLHDRGYASIGCTHCTQPGRRPRGPLGGHRQDRVRPPRAGLRTMDPLLILFGLGVGHPRRHDRHGRRLADDAAADPRLRDQAGRRRRHRPRLRRDHQDRRRLAALPPGHGRRPRSRCGWRVGSMPGRARRRARCSTACRPLRRRDRQLRADRRRRRAAAHRRRRALRARCSCPPWSSASATTIEPLERRHKVARRRARARRVGFVLGVTSAGSGTLIAVGLILVFRLTPAARRRHRRLPRRHRCCGSPRSPTWSPATSTCALAGDDPHRLGPRRVDRHPPRHALPADGLRPALGVVLLASGARRC